MMNNYIKTKTKEIIDIKKLETIGIVGEKNIDLFVNYFSHELFYLQYNINKHLMSYIAKVESKIKTSLTKNEKIMSLNKAIIQISQHPNKYLSQEVWNFNHRFPNKLGDYKKFISLLCLFRMGRNYIMHGESDIIGKIYSENHNIQTIYKIKHESFSNEGIQKLLSSNLIQSFIYQKNEVSFLALVIFTISFFVRPKIFKYIATHIDYEIYMFCMKNAFVDQHKLYKLIGLDLKWIKKMKIDNF